jgi:hypothetical protein
MNKTIYLREDEGPIWERARELANDKLSPIIVAALKKFIQEKEAEFKGFERIEIGFSDATRNHMPTRKAFFGQWIFPLKKPFRFSAEMGSDTVENYAIARTVKNNFVFFRWLTDPDSRWNETFVVFPSLEAAVADPDHAHAAREAVVLLGVPIEELDI